MYLCDILRPKNFDEIIGQDNVKEYFIKIRDKINSGDKDFAKNYILYGFSGVGKTSLVNVFANEIKAKYFYFDVSLFSDVESFKNIREVIEGRFMFSNEYIVLCFDEMQEASKKSQSLLLNLLENNLDYNIFFFFTTTDINKIIDTVRGRCIELYLNNISSDDMYKYLSKVISDNNIDISNDMLNKIIYFSNGSLRIALNFIDKVKIGGIDLKFFDDIDFFSCSLEDLKKYSVNDLVLKLNKFMYDYFIKNYENNFLNTINIFEIFMKYRNFINNYNDFICLLLMLRKVKR